MALLVLSLDNQVLAEYNMNKERYTIGRLPDNDIRIDNSAVSGHHSLIINILNDSFQQQVATRPGRRDHVGRDARGETRIYVVVGKALADVHRALFGRTPRHNGEDRGANVGKFALEPDRKSTRLTASA